MSVVSHLINGELVESQRTLDVTNPSTGKVIRHVADASAGMWSAPLPQLKPLFLPGAIRRPPSAPR